jgi:regulatory protein
VSLPRTPRSLKARALQWLAQREQSRSELRRKLLRAAVMEEQVAVAASGSAHHDARSLIDAGADTDTDVAASIDLPASSAAQRVDALLDWLEAHDFLSHERFVESRIHARAARFGNLRIRQELKQHQLTLPPELARSLNDSERQRAREVRARKFDSLPTTAAEHARQSRYLAARGFSPEAIARALRDRPEDEDPLDD